LRERRARSTLFSVKTLLTFLLCFPLAACASSEKTVLVAGSDFQAQTDARGAATVREILNQIKKDGYENIDGFLFCGDYTTRLNNRRGESESGISALKNALFPARLGIEPHELVLIQGNHDPVGTAGLAPSGDNDPAHRRYGVFVINEDDYMWYQGDRPTNGNPKISDDEDTVRRAAENLDSYLNQKYKQKFSAPIFICSHLPLHYSMRTYHHGDARYAKHLLDVINRHAENGLNIFFLYGHNHSNGWDNYLGGGRVFLPPGEKIPICVPENSKRCKIREIAFTYMNAGYTGYVSTTDPNDGADRTLSLSLFEIDADGNVTAKRYSPQGKCPLKAPGVPNTKNNNEESKLGLY